MLLEFIPPLHFGNFPVRAPDVIVSSVVKRLLTALRMKTHRPSRKILLIQIHGAADKGGGLFDLLFRHAVEGYTFNLERDALVVLFHYFTLTDRGATGFNIMLHMHTSCVLRPLGFAEISVAVKPSLDMPDSMKQMECGRAEKADFFYRRDLAGQVVIDQHRQWADVGSFEAVPPLAIQRHIIWKRHGQHLFADALRRVAVYQIGSGVFENFQVVCENPSARQIRKGEWGSRCVCRQANHVPVRGIRHRGFN